MGNPDLEKAKREVDAVTGPKKDARAANKAGLKLMVAKMKKDIIRRRDAAVDEANADMEVAVHFEQNIDAYNDSVFKGTEYE